MGIFYRGCMMDTKFESGGLSVFAVLSVCVACSVFKYIKIAPKVTIF